MRRLTGVQVLSIWESGLGQHPLDRALTMLMFSGRSRAELARLSMGSRDAMLCEVRRRLFGDRLAGYSECVRCAAPVEFTVAASELPVAAGPGSDEIFPSSTGAAFRLPNSLDLASILRTGDAGAARRELLERCVQSAETMDDAGLEQVSREMAERDPGGCIEMRLACPACQSAWTAAFDMASFFWMELNVYAKRLLAEVDTLARAYGWSEQAILDLSPVRRRLYLEMVGA